MEARGVIEEARIRWAEGEVEHKPPRPGAAMGASTTAPEHAASPSSGAAHGRTLGAAIETYIALYRRERRPNAKMVSQAEGELRVLTDALGPETPVSAVSTADAGRICEALRFLPGRFRERPELAGQPFFEMAREARRRELEPLSPRRINGYISTMSSLFEQERRAGQATANPFEGKHVKVASSGGGERGFEREEIAAIFGSPLFNGARSERSAYRPGEVLVDDWRFWAPVLALLSGARVSEIAQLSPHDVRQVSGVWVMNITAEGGKRVKTLTSVRSVPLHRQLIRLGLPELAQDMGNAGEPRLLPRVPGAIGGDPGKQLSKWMSEKLLPRFDFEKRPGLGFHSFRHAMATALRVAGVDSRIADRILGHAYDGQGARYGKFELAAVADELNRIELPATITAIPPRPRRLAAPVSIGEPDTPQAAKPSSRGRPRRSGFRSPPETALAARTPSAAGM
jgi:integrase